ncbi:hypothetical protein ACNKF0_21010 [Nocardioides sp. T5]|uniref:hypothetical protein n=1 Tax=Nocardioides sp. T5 TaxID=3400182 RepID=UPI003A8C4368
MTKVMTVVGTRPEIIRLSETISSLDRTVDHVLVHTGQNYDHNLNEIFFSEPRPPGTEALPRRRHQQPRPGAGRGADQDRGGVARGAPGRRPGPR